MNDKKYTLFTGTIDDLLNRAIEISNKMDETPRIVEFNQEDYDDCIDYIMTSENLDRESAIGLYNQIRLQEVSDIIQDLVDKGLLEVVSYDETGEPKYGLTDQGKDAAKQIKKKS